MKHTSGLLLFCSLLSLPLVAQTNDLVEQPHVTITSPLVEVAPASHSSVGRLTDDQVNEAILQGVISFSSKHSVGLRLNDVQTSMLTSMACRACAETGYTITVYTPELWISMESAQAKREMRPYSLADVTEEMRDPLLHVVALPSTPRHLTGVGFSLSSSAYRVVLADTERQIIIQPVTLENGAVETNSAFRSASFGTAEASFRMDDVERLRAQDSKGEFFVVVVGKQNKFFKVKAKFKF